MAKIDFKSDWKNIAGTKTEQNHKAEVKRSKVRKEHSDNLGRDGSQATKSFLKRMKKVPEKAEVKDKSGLPQDKALTKGKKPAESQQKVKENRQKAEGKYQEIRNGHDEYQRQVVKGVKPEDPKLQTKEQDQKLSDKAQKTEDKGQTTKGSTTVAKEVVRGTKTEVKPHAEKKGSKKLAKKSEKPEVKSKEGQKKPTSTAKAEKTKTTIKNNMTKSDADGGKETGKEANLAGSEVNKVAEVKKKKTTGKKVTTAKKKGKGKSGKRVAYTGAEDAQRTTGGLSNLESGEGSESPFDLAPQDNSEIKVAEYEPVEWITNIEVFAEDANPEYLRVFQAATEFNQRVKKSVTEKIEYENWEADKSIQERFVLETEEMVKYAQDVIKELRGRGRFNASGKGMAC